MYTLSIYDSQSCTVLYSEFRHSCLILHGPIADKKLRHADVTRIG